jgi:hypothetical protein
MRLQSARELEHHVVSRWGVIYVRPQKVCVPATFSQLKT